MLGIQPPAAAAPIPPNVSIGGVLPIVSLASKMAEQVREETRRHAQQTQAAAPINDLANHVRKCWSVAYDAKRQTVEPRMFQSLRQRRGEYDPDILSKIKATQGSEIYMMLTAVKCRAASSWLRDT